MRARAAVLALWCAVVAAGIQAQDTISVPKKPKTYVTDRPKVLSAATKTALEEKLKKFGDETGNQVVVWIGSTLPADATIEEYANASFNLWGIGQKEKNNGVLLMLFVKSRKMRIESGDGIRDRLPDARAAAILDEMKPHLRSNDYDTAVNNATDSIVQALTPPPPPPPRPKRTPQPVAAAQAEPPKSFADVAPTCAIIGFAGLFGLLLVAVILRAIIRGLAAGASMGGGAPRLFTDGGGGGVNRTRVDHYHHNRSSGWSWGSRRSEPTRTVHTVVHHRDDDDDDNRGGGGSSSSGSSGSSGSGFSGGGSSRGGGASDSW